MAVVIEKYTREDGHEIAVYESGAHYDLTASRLVKPAQHTVYNPETSMQSVERRLELKREAVMRGAAKVLENSGEWEKPNDIDVIEAISEAVMMKALNPKDAKQIDAARYITQEGGYSESQPSSTVSASNMAASAFGSELARQFAQIIGDVLQAKAAQPPAADVIDVQADNVTRNQGD